jgi:O-Antigen ligase
MNYQVVFLIHLSLSILLVILFARNINLPKDIKLISFSIFVNSPMYVAVSGALSCIYLSDIVLPLVCSSAILRGTRSRTKEGRVLTAFALLLVILPVISLSINYISGYARSDSGRFSTAAALWLFRHLNLFALLRYGIYKSLSVEQYLSFLKYIIILSSAMAVLGIANYIFGVDLASFEHLLAIGDGGESGQFISESRIGYGFLGLFRATVGQWCAVTCVLLIGTARLFDLKWKGIAIFLIGVFLSFILFSLSRAGIVSLVSGLCVLAYRSRNSSLRFFLALVSVIFVIVAAYYSSDAVIERLFSIFDQRNDEAIGLRYAAWTKSFEFFASNIFFMIFGIGPSDDEAIFNLIGTFGAHNEFIDSIFRVGMLGPIIILWILYLIYNRFDGRRSNWPPSMQIIGQSLVGVLVVNVVCSYTQNHLIQTYSTYSCGAFLYLIYGVSIGLALRNGRAGKLDIAY